MGVKFRVEDLLYLDLGRELAHAWCMPNWRDKGCVQKAVGIAWQTTCIAAIVTYYDKEVSSQLQVQGPISR